MNKILMTIMIIQIFRVKIFLISLKGVKILKINQKRKTHSNLKHVYHYYNNMLFYPISYKEDIQK